MKAVLILALVVSLVVLVYGKAETVKDWHSKQAAIFDAKREYAAYYFKPVEPAGSIVRLAVPPPVPAPEVKKEEKQIVVDTKPQAHGEAAKALADVAGKYFQNYVFINIKIKYLYIYFFFISFFYLQKKWEKSLKKEQNRSEIKSMRESLKSCHQTHATD